MLFRFWVFPDCTFLDISNLDVYTHTDYNVVKRAFDQAAANL